jgi:hypothetical protein
MNAEFKQSAPKRFAVSEISVLDPVDPVRNPRLCIRIRQLSKPLAKHILSSPRDLAADFNHGV